MSLQAYTSYTYSPGFKSGEFHHAVLSISGTIHTLYLDGSAVTVNPGQPDIFNVYNTITNTVIGAQANVLTQAFKGIIGDVRVYNYAISATQVSSLYLNRNLVIHYPFDSSVNKMTPNYATMLYDASMIGNLSLTTGITTGTNAFSFTNSSTTATQYVKSAPSNWLLNSTTGLTISCWVNTAGASTGNIMRIFDIPLDNKKTGLSVDISGSNMIYSGYIDKVINITSNLSIPFSTNGLPLTANNTYYSIALTDYGDIIVATASGIYYSRDFGNTFILSTITICTSVSMNNTGNALASNSNTIYYSNNYGVSWTVVNTTISTTIKQVFVTQTGLTYILCYFIANPFPNSTYSIYSSNDFFKTNSTLLNSGNGGPYAITFSSNGNGAFSGNAFLNFYSASTSSWIGGGTGPNIGGGISDNGSYIAGLNLGVNKLYFKNLPTNTIDTNWITSYSIGVVNATAQIIIGNNGVAYYQGNSIIYKYKDGTITNTGYLKHYLNIIPISPNGNFAVTYGTIGESTASNATVDKLIIIAS